MASYNVLQSGMPTLPSTVSNYNGSSGRSITPNNGRNNIVRVTSVNIDDGSITYETLQNNTGRSFLGNPLPLTAKIANNTISSIPVIGELVEIFNAPSVDLANNKSQPVFDT